MLIRDELGSTFVEATRVQFVESRDLVYFLAFDNNAAMVMAVYRSSEDAARQAQDFTYWLNTSGQKLYDLSENKIGGWASEGEILQARRRIWD